MRILAFAASLRRGSLNRKLIAVAAEEARSAGAEVDRLDWPAWSRHAPFG